MWKLLIGHVARWKYCRSCVGGHRHAGGGTDCARVCDCDCKETVSTIVAVVAVMPFRDRSVPQKLRFVCESVIGGTVLVRRPISWHREMSSPQKLRSVPCWIGCVSSTTSSYRGESGEVDGAKEGVSGGENSCERQGGVGPVSASPFGRRENRYLV